MSEHTARVVELAYEEHGPKSARAIVLLHGSPLDRRMWKPQLEDFVGAGYRVVLPDLRGHGQSPTPSAPWSVANCAADVFALRKGTDLVNEQMPTLGPLQDAAQNAHLHPELLKKHER